MSCTFLIGGLFGMGVVSLTLIIGLIIFYQFYYRPEISVPKNLLSTVYDHRINRICTLICGIITGIVWVWADTTFMIVEEIVKNSFLQSGSAGVMSAFFIPMNLGAIIASVCMLIFSKTIHVSTERSAFWVIEGLLLGGLGAGVAVVIYFITFPWFFFFSLAGAFIVGSRGENALSGASPDVPAIIYGYKTGLFIGGIILGGGLGLLSIGIIREILGKKIWQWGAHNLWGLLAGLSIGAIYSIIFVWIQLIRPEIMPFGRYLTQAQVAKSVGVFCLPTVLPTNVESIPIFYKTGDPSIPDVAVLYKDKKTSERVFIIVINDVSETSLVQNYGEYNYYDPAQSCKDKRVLSNGLQACYEDWSLRPIRPSSRESMFEGPPFITSLSWQIQHEKLVTIYSIESSLSVEETKPIAASICSE